MWVFRGFFLLSFRYRHICTTNPMDKKDSTQIKCAVKVKEIETTVVRIVCEWKEGRAWTIYTHTCVNEPASVCVYANVLRKKGKNTVNTVLAWSLCVHLYLCEWINFTNPNRFFHVRKSITSLSFLFLLCLIHFLRTNFPKHILIHTHNTHFNHNYNREIQCLNTISSFDSAKWHVKINRKMCTCW